MTAIDSYENKDEKQQTQRLGLRLLKQGWKVQQIQRLGLRYLD
jgi:hypothetical protein